MRNFGSALSPFLTGLLFALGLGVAGMTEPANIISFLDVFGDWSPVLAFVMIGAIVTNTLLLRLISRSEAPLFAEAFQFPKKKDLDRKLIFGSALFGIGWGITGLCPGPGWASLTSGNEYAYLFVTSLTAGMTAVKLWESLKASAQKI